MTKRETLLSLGGESDSADQTRTPSEKKAFQNLLAKIEEKYPHLKRAERLDDPLADGGKLAVPAQHSRGRRHIRK